MGIPKSLTRTREGRKSLPPQLSSKVKVSLKAGLRERWARGGERRLRRLRAGALRRRPPLFTRAARCVSLLCGCDAAVARGSRLESRAEGAGPWSQAGWGVRAPRNGNFAGSAGAGGRASSLHCACRPRRWPRGVLPPGPLRRPAGQFPRRRALAASASAPGPQPRSRRPAPGRRGSGAGWGWGRGPGRRVPGARLQAGSGSPGAAAAWRAGFPALGLRALPRDAPLPSPKVVPRTPELGSGKARKCAETRSRPAGWGLAPLPLSSAFIFCVLFPCKERSSCSPWPSC